MTDQMQCIITALKAESDPFIHHLELIRDPAFKFPCFRNDDLGIALVGVGVGKRKIRTRINIFFDPLTAIQYNSSILVLLEEGKTAQD